MKHIPTLLLTLALSTASPTAFAQDDSAPAENLRGDLNSLIDEGAQLLLRSLQDEMKPLMEDLAIELEPKLKAFATDLLPMLEGFSDLVGDLDNYHPPEKLPNGDVIFRRKTAEEIEQDGKDGEVEL